MDQSYTKRIHYLFTYGTLQRGFHNHRLLEDSTFICKAKTLEKYGLYIHEGLPFVIKSEPVSHIHGELFLINTLTLIALDRLEGHPGWYKRKQVKIFTHNESSSLAWLYFGPHPIGTLVKSGRYEP